MIRRTADTGRSDAHADEIRTRSTPLERADDLDPLLERIGDARHVLIGEASHGTSEYYRWRAELSRRLITECGFSFVAVEGDWPDCYEVNRWVKGRSRQDRSATEVLGQYRRWPTWMWANEEVAEFIDWLRDHNRDADTQVGFYGLDVYSLWDSLRVALGYLEEYRPDDLDTAYAALSCFEPYGEDPQTYAASTRIVPEGCENEVVHLLGDLRRDAPTFDSDPEAQLDAVQNAEVLRGAERYYRTMVRGGPGSWNVRDHHMVDTLDRLVEHHGPDCRSIVWEHNTHIGDARATDMASSGMVNVGQLVRERRSDEGVFLVGFGGHHGSVIAGSSWGAPAQRLPVPDAPAGTHEDLMHHALGRPGLLDLADAEGSEWLTARRGHRAIGVVYHPERDHFGNWVPTSLGRRYDAFLFFDGTEALHPLDNRRAGDDELETYPWTA
jgi:erythromycin esterase